MFEDRTTPTALEILQREFKSSPYMWIFIEFRELATTLKDRTMTITDWNFQHTLHPPYDTHKYYYTVLARMNGAIMIGADMVDETTSWQHTQQQCLEKLQRLEKLQSLEKQQCLEKLQCLGKLQRFVDAHCPLIAWINANYDPDNLSACSDAALDNNGVFDSVYPHVEPYFSRNDLISEIRIPPRIYERPPPAQVLSKIFPAQADIIFCDFRETIRRMCAQPDKVQLNWQHWPLDSVLSGSSQIIQEKTTQMMLEIEIMISDFETSCADITTVNTVFFPQEYGASFQKGQTRIAECVQRLDMIKAGVPEEDELFDTISVQNALDEAQSSLQAVKSAIFCIRKTYESVEEQDDNLVELIEDMMEDFIESIETAATTAEEGVQHFGKVMSVKKRVQKYVAQVEQEIKTLQTEWWHDYRIMTALYYRVNYAYELMNVQNLAEPIKYQLQLFIDTHLPLAQFLSDTHVCTDVLLCTPDASELAPFQRNYPYETRMFHEGDLPCMTKAYNYVSFLSESGMSRNNWHYINSKLTPKCCLGRGFDTIHDTKCEGSDSVLKWSALALECSLLGVYEHAKVRPCFKQRLRIHKFMNSDLDTGVLFNFQINNDVLVLFVEREFMITQIRYCTALYETICTLYDGWKAFENSVLTMMDTVRHVFSTTGSLTEARRVIERKSNIDKPRVYRQQTTDFIKYLVAQIQAVDEKMFMESVEPPGCVIDETMLEPEQRKRIEEFVLRLTPNQTVPLQWLQSFGMHASGVATLQKAQDIFTKGATGDLTVRDILPHLSATEYAIVGYFARLFLKHSSLRVIDIDLRMYQDQMRAIRRFYNLEPNEPFPRQGGIFCYAPCCQQVKSFLSGSKVKKAYGQIGVIYDDELNRLICGRRSDRNESKKRNNQRNKNLNSKRIESVKTRQKKEIKRVQKARNTMICIETDVIRIPLVGRILEVDHVKNKDTQSPFTLCPQCGEFTDFSMGRYHTNGFACKTCALLETNTSQIPHCFACRNTSISPGTQQVFAQFCLLDDLPGGDLLFKYMWICNKCSRRWIHQSAGTLTCADIMRGLRDFKSSDNFYEFFEMK